ncbi:MAG TPA: hypothetical protein VIV65_09415 [Gemmatimonadaceae bacterium]
MSRTTTPRRVPSAGTVIEDGRIAELVYEPKDGTTAFAVGAGDSWRTERELALPGDVLLVPYSPTNNLLTHDVVALPSLPAEYGTEEELIARVRAFIHHYVDLPEGFEELACRYVLFTWRYDDFAEVPYLRVRGDYGTGKSRFLLTIGLLCYRAIFASGASSVSSLFRIMDAFRGTLILDEGDFRFSDEKAELTKILNNGHARGFPVLRTEQSAATKEFNPRAFTVFGPKVIATRNLFDDRALESRCLSEVLHARAVRPDIPLNLDDAFRQEARQLRSQLLLYRLRTKSRTTPATVLDNMEPRTAQILRPLLATVGDEETALRVAEHCRASIAADTEDRRDGAVEAQVLEALLAVARHQSRITAKDVADEFSRRIAGEEGWKPTPRWIGSVLRRRLYLRTAKVNGNFVVPPSELARLPDLARRYGISLQVDVGDVGEVAEEGPRSSTEL